MFYSTKYDKYLSEGTPFQLGENLFPANWLNHATTEEKAQYEILDVVYTNERPDDRYYWINEEYNKEKITYVATPKDLDGLKKAAIDQANNIVWTTLQPTDFMDSRKANDPTYEAPAEWVTWRASVREAAATYKAAVNATTTIEEFIAVPALVIPNDPSYVAPVESAVQETPVEQPVEQPTTV